MNRNSLIASEEKSISEVLRQTGLKFPAYQRPYEWQSAINRQFFTDLTSHSLYYSTARTSEERKRNGQYFLGPYYIKGNGVLDGQQRLTSLAIWNNAEIDARNCVKKWIESCQNSLSNFKELVIKAECQIKERDEQLKKIKSCLTDLWILNLEEELGLKKSSFGIKDYSKESGVSWTKKTHEAFFKLAKSLVEEDKFERREDERLTSFKEVVEYCSEKDPGIAQPLVKVDVAIKNLTKELGLGQLPKIESASEASGTEKHLMRAKLIINKINFPDGDEFNLPKIHFTSDNHVEHERYKEIEKFCSILFTGKFNLKTISNSTARELTIGVKRQPRTINPNGKIARSSVAKKWRALTRNQNDCYSLKAVVSGIASNDGLPPHEQNYFGAYVFYFYHSFATALTKYFSDNNALSQKIRVNGDDASHVFLSDVSDRIVVTEMRLDDNLGDWDAQKLFHTINARGLSLSDSDKVRNLLISGERRDDDARVGESFAKLVELFLTAGDLGIKLGFQENDVFYWANQFVNKKNQTTQKSFVANVEETLRKEKYGPARGDYSKEFVQYLSDFCEFFDWLAKPCGQADEEKFRAEYRLILSLDFPKATFPLLFALHKRFFSELRDEHGEQYRWMLVGVGLYFLKRRCDLFKNAGKVDTFTKLLKRTHSAIAEISDQPKSIQGLSNWVKKWFPQKISKTKDGKKIDHFLHLSESSEKFFTSIAKKVDDGKSNASFYGGNNSVISRYLLYSSAIYGGGAQTISWNSDLEHLVFPQSKSEKLTNRLGNIFLLKPSINRSLGDADPGEKFKILHKKGIADNTIYNTEAYRFLKDNFLSESMSEEEVSSIDAIEISGITFKIQRSTPDDMAAKFEERETKLLADLTARVQLSHQTLIGLP